MLSRPVMLEDNLAERVIVLSGYTGAESAPGTLCWPSAFSHLGWSCAMLFCWGGVLSASER
nr:hypothetical protein [Erwinia sp. Ejp617]